MPQIFTEFAEAFRMAVDALRSNLLRAILTTGGVVVGVVIVVLMGWAINGLDSVWEKTISIIGKDMIYVDKWNWSGGGNWRDHMARKDITLDQAWALSSRMESAEATMPLIRKWAGNVSVGNQSIMSTVMGTTADFGITPAGKMTSGRFFTPVEEQLGERVVAIGSAVADKFFPDKNPVGTIIKIQNIPFRIVGVIEKRGFLFLDFIDNEMYVPLEAFRSAFGFYDRSFSIAIKTGSESLLPIARDEAIGHMREIRNVHPADPDDFSLNEMQAFDDQVKSIRLGIWVGGILLTIISFIVGSIGIMNIMFVSVTERTKEIGIRKAIGAKRSSILLQFLVEASVLCVTGALLAFPIVQFIISSIKLLLVNILKLSWAEPISGFIPLDLLGIAIVVSAVVGILAGFIPAFKASRLDPVEALRAE